MGPTWRLPATPPFPPLHPTCHSHPIPMPTPTPSLVRVKSHPPSAQSWTGDLRGPLPSLSPVSVCGMEVWVVRELFPAVAAHTQVGHMCVPIGGWRGRQGPVKIWKPCVRRLQTGCSGEVGRGGGAGLVLSPLFSLSLVPSLAGRWTPQQSPNWSS